MDNLGASNTCTATITVEDKTAPTFPCPANIATATVSNDTTVMVNFATPIATDNCGGATVTCLPVSGSAFAIGATPVVCTAVDTAGNTNTCTFTVTVTAGQTGNCSSIAALIDQVIGLKLDGWRNEYLIRRLQRAQRFQQAGQTRAAAAQMEIFARSISRLSWTAVQIAINRAPPHRKAAGCLDLGAAGLKKLHHPFP